MRNYIKVFPLRAAGGNADRRKPNFTRLWQRAGEVDDLLDHQSGLRGLT